MNVFGSHSLPLAKGNYTHTHTPTHSHPRTLGTDIHSSTSCACVCLCVCVSVRVIVCVCGTTYACESLYSTQVPLAPLSSSLRCCRTRLLWPITHLSIFTYLDRSCRRLWPPSPLPPCDPKLARWHCVWVWLWLWFWVCARVLAGLGFRASSRESRAGAHLIAEMLPFCK